MDWIVWLQGISAPAKYAATGAVLLAVVALLCVLWAEPVPTKPRDVRSSAAAPPLQPNSGGTATVNNGIMAGTYNAAPSAAEELAREQLEDLRERRARERQQAAIDQWRGAYNQRVVQIVEVLRAQYRPSEDDLSSETADEASISRDAWINAQLSARAIPYFYRANGDGTYRLDPRI